MPILAPYESVPAYLRVSLYSIMIYKGFWWFWILQFIKRKFSDWDFLCSFCSKFITRFFIGFGSCKAKFWKSQENSSRKIVQTPGLSRKSIYFFIFINDFWLILLNEVLNSLFKFFWISESERSMNQLELIKLDSVCSRVSKFWY